MYVIIHVSLLSSKGIIMTYNDDETLKQSPFSSSSTESPDISLRNADDHGPTNSEIMAEIKKNRQIMYILMTLMIITLITFIVLSIYLYKIVGEYKDEVIEAFNTMKKIDSMVEQIEADYNNYSSQIDEFFDVVSELKSYLDNFKGVIGSLPSIQLPF